MCVKNYGVCRVFATQSLSALPGPSYWVQQIQLPEARTSYQGYDFTQEGMSWFVTFPAKITTPCHGVLRAAPIVSASENTASMGSQRTVRSGFKEFENGFLVFALGHFPRNFLFGPKFAKSEGVLFCLNSMDKKIPHEKIRKKIHQAPLPTRRSWQVFIDFGGRNRSRNRKTVILWKSVFHLSEATIFEVRRRRKSCRNR